ncbi:MAG: hypothetical protein J6I31_06435 [Prevotella sp.]|nr:hypothetical protein [Prevotella sp.]
MAATQQIQMRINLRANSNRKSDFFGRLYPYIDRNGTLDTRGFCKHMSEHNTIYDRSIVEGVMTTMQGCLVELLSQGVGVKLTGIGTFYPTVQSVPGGAESVEEAQTLGADNLVQGVHVRFRPDGTKLDDITSKSMKKNCALTLHMLQVEDGTTTGADGKERKKYKYLPISKYEQQADPDPEPEP